MHAMRDFSNEKIREKGFFKEKIVILRSKLKQDFY